MEEEEAVGALELLRLTQPEGRRTRSRAGGEAAAAAAAAAAGGSSGGKRVASKAAPGAPGGKRRATPSANSADAASPAAASSGEGEAAGEAAGEAGEAGEAEGEAGGKGEDEVAGGGAAEGGAEESGAADGGAEESGATELGAADGGAEDGGAEEGGAAYGGEAYGGAALPSSGGSMGDAEMDAEAANAGGEGELPLADTGDALGSGGGSSPGGALALSMGVASGSLLDKPLSPKPEELDDFVEDLPVPSPSPSAGKRRIMVVPEPEPAVTLGSSSSSSSSSSSCLSSSAGSGSGSPGPAPLGSDGVAWSQAELKRLRQAVEQHGLDKWSLVAAKVMGGKSEVACRDKAESLRAAGEFESGRMRWSEAEVELLQVAVAEHGRSWKGVAQAMHERGSRKLASQCQAKALSLQNSGKIALPPALLENSGVQWSAEEDEQLKQGVEEHGREWGRVASLVRGRNSAQCSARATELRRSGLLSAVPRSRHDEWGEVETKTLRAAVKKHGTNWIAVAKEIGSHRTNDECRVQATYMLSYRRIEPYELQARTRWSKDEVELLYKAVEQHGRQWAKVCLHIPGRNRADVTRKAQLEMLAGRMKDPGGKRSPGVSAPAPTPEPEPNHHHLGLGGDLAFDSSSAGVGSPPPPPPLLPVSDADAISFLASAPLDITPPCSLPGTQPLPLPLDDPEPPPPPAPAVPTKRKARVEWTSEELQNLHEAVKACPLRAWTKIKQCMGSERRIGDIGRKADLEMRAQRLALSPDTTK
jgi:hypothetical protein